MSALMRDNPTEIGPYDIWAGLNTPRMMKMAQTAPVRHRPGLTLRDEANAITIAVFRNGFLERLHCAGRITDPEMKKLNIETSAMLAQWLHFRDACRKTLADKYFGEIDFFHKYARSWDREALTCELPVREYADCTGCDSKDLPLRSWSFCPWCGMKVTSPPAETARDATGTPTPTL